MTHDSTTPATETTTRPVEYRLHGFGRKFISGEPLRGYGYVRGGVTGYLPGTRAKEGPALAALRAALTTGDLAATRAAARRLPSVRIYQGTSDNEVSVSRHGASLASWYLTPRDLDKGWAAPDAIVEIPVNANGWAL